MVFCQEVAQVPIILKCVERCFLLDPWMDISRVHPKLNRALLSSNPEKLAFASLQVQMYNNFVPSLQLRMIKGPIKLTSKSERYKKINKAKQLYLPDYTERSYLIQCWSAKWYTVPSVKFHKTNRLEQTTPSRKMWQTINGFAVNKVCKPITRWVHAA